MIFPCLVRGFTPRPWKGKTDGQMHYSGSFVVLDMSPVSPIMDTMALELDFKDEAEMVRQAQLVGKSANCVVTGLRVAQDGKAKLVGSIKGATVGK